MMSHGTFDQAGGSKRAPRKLSRRLLARVAALLMIVGVVGLSTVAKNTGYLPNSNPAHYISAASKMSPVHSPDFLDRLTLHPISKLIPQKPPSRETHRNDPELPPINQIVPISIYQHRPPPVLA
jgi:hypothetical protein